MEVRKSRLGLTCIIPSVFEDYRGIFVETYNEKEFGEISNVKFVQDDFSWSRKNVLRGLHGDKMTWKLVSCPVGSVYLIVLCLDEEAEPYEWWESFVLSERNQMQVLIPPFWANGHLVLSDHAMFHYKQSTYYDHKRQFSVKWNDPRYYLKWPVSNPILSERDE